jgi:hypothetical protein
VTSHDAINAVFEGGGAIFLCLNVRRLIKDKSVKGVSLLTTSWWTAWGFWNVYFYSAVNTPASFYAGIAVVFVNAMWLGLAVRYARKEAAREAWLAAPVEPLGKYGLPLCSCAMPKDVIPNGCTRAFGWCGRCGKDLVAS